MPEPSKKRMLLADKLVAWLESELRKNEEAIRREKSAARPSLDGINEYEGRIWAYKLTQQFVQMGGAAEAGAVCGACGGTDFRVITGAIACAQCYEFRGSECSMVPATSRGGKTAIQQRRIRQKAGVPEDEL